MPITAPYLAPPAICRVLRSRGESVTRGDSPADQNEIALGLGRSAFWPNLVPFLEVHSSMRAEVIRAERSRHYAEPPNELAQSVARRVLNILEGKQVPPGRVSATVDGGLALGFIANSRRATIEIDNEGEIVIAAYSATGDPEVWQIPVSDGEIAAAADKIRVYLAS
jgi:hypothetical protein